ncbi:DUF2214 family protein [Gallaecimonas pentaromativorans]|uniref:Putative membrane protein n=1 Tax=Gallaecimonas pentaromativorans TaxID=584787 RepID=A0A3N1PAV8_9GAMM|nr:DUF2214 family protein [Gallaecimonas pentaromativorans]ROQ24207.1 putative membrane protein [Gallaecimonas pentaromativorans]
MDDIFFRYLHFIGMMALMATLVAEHLLLAPTMTPAELKRLARIDTIFGLSALVVLAAGLTLWFGVGKPAVFYSHNWVFHLKITLFVLAALLSIYPTLFYRKHRNSSAETVAMPKVVVMLIRTELLLLLVIPLLAVLMAKGIGLS